MNETTTESDPPELVAVIVASVADCSTVGVPLITPVEEFIEIPVGNPVALQVTLPPPLLVGADRVKAVNRCSVCALGVTRSGICWLTSIEKVTEFEPE